MSTVQEIKQAIDSLPAEERKKLEQLLQPVPRPTPMVSLPNQAERRRRILGDKVLPNLVIEARETESA